MFFNEFQQITLIVVSKDELLTNLLKKYVETNDDIDEENVIGTKDGTVKIVAWDEKVWLDNKKAGNIGDKVLLIGEVKGVDKLIPIIDIKYNKFGIKYGWAGNQAILTVDPKKLSNETDYNTFFEAFQKTAVSKTYLQNVKNDKEEKNEVKKVEKVIQGLILLIDPVNAAIAGFFENLGRSFGNKETIKKQQFFYGLTQLYENHLAEFLH